jgi:hypothetical protein
VRLVVKMLDLSKDEFRARKAHYVRALLPPPSEASASSPAAAPEDRF